MIVHIHLIRPALHQKKSVSNFIWGAVTNFVHEFLRDICIKYLPFWKTRMNNPQAKVLTTVPRVAYHQGVVSYTVSLGNQATS